MTEKAQQPKNMKNTKKTKTVTVTKQPVAPVETVSETVNASEKKAVDNKVATASHKNRKNKISDELNNELKFKKNVQDFHAKINEQSKSLKILRDELKKIEVSYNHDLTKVLKSKTRKASNTPPTGFVKKVTLPPKMAKLIGAAENTVMSMPDYTAAFYEEMEKRKLFYEGDKRVFRADKEIMEVFKLNDSVNKSVDYKDKEGFNFSTLQRHFSKAIKEFQPVATKPAEQVKAVEEAKPVEQKQEASATNKTKKSAQAVAKTTA
jgi:hypothetical protein